MMPENVKKTWINLWPRQNHITLIPEDIEKNIYLRSGKEKSNFYDAKKIQINYDFLLKSNCSDAQTY